MKMKRFYLVGLILLLSLSTVFSSPQKEASAEGPVELEFWTNQTQEYRVAAYKEIADAFHAKFPNYTIEVVPYGEEVEFVTKWASAKMAGQLPNVVEAEQWAALKIIYAGTGNPDIAEPVIKSLGESDFYKFPLAFVKYKGRYQAVPNSVFANAVFCRKDIFEKGGLASFVDKVTTDDLLAAARKLHNPAARQYGVTITTGKEIYVQNIGYIGNAFGTRMYDKSGKIVVNSSMKGKWQELLTYYKSLAENTQPGPQTASDLFANFTSGATAMSIVATFLPRYVTNTDPALRDQTTWAWEIVKYNPGTYFCGVAYIPIAGMEANEAKATQEWLKFVMSGDQRLKYLDLVPGGFNAVRKSVATSDAYLNNDIRKQWGRDFFLGMAEASANASYWGLFPDGTVITSVGDAITSLAVQEELFSICEENKSIDQAIADMDKRLKEAIGQ